MLVVVMENGYAKQTSLKEYKKQSRGGSGIKTAEVTAKTGLVISAHVVSEEKEIFALSAKGQMIRTELGTVRKTGRSAQGVRIMDLRSGDRLTTWLHLPLPVPPQATQSEETRCAAPAAF